MLDILFLNPITYFNKNEHSHFQRDWCGGEVLASIIYPNLDFAYAAALVRQNGIKADLLDANALHLTYSQILQVIEQKKPGFISIPSSWLSFPHDIELAKMINGRAPSVKIIISGPNVTADPVLALESGFIDYVILGEIEFPCLEIVKGDINYNIAYKLNDRVIIKERKLFDNLDSLPFPARDLMPNQKYLSPFTKSNPFTMMFASRGCSHQCIFCPAAIWYMNKVRFRSVGNIVREIDEIVNKYGIKDIIFKDLSLTINKKLCFDLCEEIIRKGHKINWRCFSCVDTIDKELLTVMKKAGCYQISYGIESGSQRVLDLNKKAITILQTKEAIRLTRAAGIEASGSFIFGLIGDTYQTVKETLNFAIGLNLDYVQFQLAVPMPATELYRICEEKGYLFKKLSESHWYDSKTINYPWLSNEILQDTLRKAYRKFYFRYPFIYSQIMKTKNIKQFCIKLGTLIELLRRVK